MRAVGQAHLELIQPDAQPFDERSAFLANFGSAYDCPGGPDFAQLRARDYRRLDEQNHVYLDYVGGSLHATSQVEKHAEVLNCSVLGNPHSANPASQTASEYEEECRARVLAYFNADPREFEVVFTMNASHALKLVGEAFPFRLGSRFLYTADSHSSVVGVRRYARSRRAKATCCPVRVPDLRLDEERVLRELERGSRTLPRLFALTGQSNTTGVRHPLRLITAARQRGWSVLLDAAALAPTSQLDLGRFPADFVAISFYKMFGYPTGIGCLIARRAALATLERPWFAGGTVRLVSAFHDDVYFMTSPSEGSHFQDGTIPYGALPAVTIGLDHLAAIDPARLGTRLTALTSWLLQELPALTHSNGAPLVKLYGPSNATARGATLALNLFDRDGRWIPHRVVEQAAASQGISIRTGCFCNPGIAEQALGYSKHSECPPNKLGDAYVWAANKLGVDRLLAGIKPFDRPFGMVRASFGVASNFEDAWRWRQFLAGFLDRERVTTLTRAYAESFRPPATLC